MAAIFFMQISRLKLWLFIIHILRQVAKTQSWCSHMIHVPSGINYTYFFLILFTFNVSTLLKSWKWPSHSIPHAKTTQKNGVIIYFIIDYRFWSEIQDGHQTDPWYTISSWKQWKFVYQTPWGLQKSKLDKYINGVQSLYYQQKYSNLLALVNVYFLVYFWLYVYAELSPSICLVLVFVTSSRSFMHNYFTLKLTLIGFTISCTSL